MKTKLLLLALVAAMAIPMQGQNFRHSDNVTVNNKFEYTPSREVIPEGMVVVTLAAGDVWGDGSGYQMLLDADANTYGDIIPTSGPLSLYSSVSDAVYAEFEYKIPENADGSLYTENVVYDDAVSILIPAGTYDWCITNPEYGYAMWIASDYGELNARCDDYVFEAGNEYVFTCYMTEYGYDGVSLEVIVGETPDVELPTAPVITVQTNDLDVVLGATEVEGAVVTFYQCDDQEGNNPVEIENPTSFVRETENYVVYVYAVATNAAGETSSVVTMVVIPARVLTAIDELTNGKTVAGVRYFNMAGQEMTEANGMTIMVTTYTDGTTSAVKVVK